MSRINSQRRLQVRQQLVHVDLESLFRRGRLFGRLVTGSGSRRFAASDHRQACLRRSAITTGARLRTMPSSPAGLAPRSVATRARRCFRLRRPTAIPPASRQPDGSDAASRASLAPRRKSTWSAMSRRPSMTRGSRRRLQQRVRRAGDTPSRQQLEPRVHRVDQRRCSGRINWLPAGPQSRWKSCRRRVAGAPLGSGWHPPGSLCSRRATAASPGSSPIVDFPAPAPALVTTMTRPRSVKVRPASPRPPAAGRPPAPPDRLFARQARARPRVELEIEPSTGTPSVAASSMLRTTAGQRPAKEVEGESWHPAASLSVAGRCGTAL